MADNKFPTLILTVAALLALPGCTQKPSGVPEPAAAYWKSLEGVRQAAAGASGRPVASIDVTRSEYRMAIAMTAAQASNSDIPAMQSEAATVASAVEKLGKNEPELAAIQALSVAFVHQHGTSDNHTDDVFNFRRESSGAFKYNAM